MSINITHKFQSSVPEGTDISQVRTSNWNDTHLVPSEQEIVAAAVTGSTDKTTPVDADMLPLVDSAASNILKKLTWANLKATLALYFLPLSGGTITGPIVGNAASGPKQIIKPLADSTTALQVTKADGTTAVFIVNTSSPGIVTPAWSAPGGGNNINLYGGYGTSAISSYNGTMYDMIRWVNTMGSNFVLSLLPAVPGNVGVGTPSPTEKFSLGDTNNISLGNLAKVAATSNAVILKNGVLGTVIPTGTIVVGSALGLQAMAADGSINILGSHTAPASATATGTAGEIRFCSDYVYYCTATNTWVRAALATW